VSNAVNMADEGLIKPSKRSIEIRMSDGYSRKVYAVELKIPLQLDAEWTKERIHRSITSEFQKLLDKITFV